MSKKTFEQQGFTILEVIISLIVLISLMGLGATYMKSNADKALNQNTAATLGQVTEAAKNYVRDNYAKIYTEVETGLEHNISLENENNELINNNYLSKNVALTNSYGQKYTINISKEAEDLMRIMILTTGGEKIEDGSMMQTTAILGGDAGYISSRSSDKITGSQQAWTIPVITAATVGHLATVNYLSKKDIVSAGDFLRRTKTTGHDEWNTMETDITMKENNITFKDNKNAEGLINSTGTVLKDGQQSSTQTAQSLGFESNTQNLAATKVTADYVKPGMIEMDAYQVSEVYAKADTICGGVTLENTNKMFSIKVNSNNNIYSFICGRKDGYELGSGRAYLHSFSGIDYGLNLETLTGNININTKCSTWDFVNNKGADNCADVLLANTSDKRLASILIKTVRSVGSRPDAVNVWIDGKCQEKSRGSENGNLCQVKVVTNLKFYNYEFNQSIINTATNGVNPAAAIPDKNCTQAGIGGWNGDLQNIWVKGESDNNEYKYGSCKILKYHDNQ